MKNILQKINRKKINRKPGLFILLTVLLLISLNFAPAVLAATGNPLPSWHDGPQKMKIITFVETVSDRQNPNYVKPEERVAVFDNDGTMWLEQPLYSQLIFVFSHIRELAPQHPEWREQQPFKALLENDRKTLSRYGNKGIFTLMAASSSGSGDYAAGVRKWAQQYRHPRFRQPLSGLVYQPMLELLNYLKNNDFTVFIVSGGGIDFMRALLPELYDIPSWRIIGSCNETAFADGQIVRKPKIAFVNNGPGKAVAIHRNIGKRPILACGNSDGDLEMLEYTAAGTGPSLEILIHHTDAEREYAYDRKSRIGTLDQALDYAKEHDWMVVDMKKEWKTVFANQPQKTTEKTAGGK